MLIHVDSARICEDFLLFYFGSAWIYVDLCGLSLISDNFLYL